MGDNVKNAALEALREDVRQFARERDWEQFHSPKNLAIGLSVEASEILEHFQWLSQAESGSLPEDTRDAVRLELADVFIYLIRLADTLDVDLVNAAREKMKVNADKYPVEKVKGNATKYDRL
ncbi:MAG TPA: nucleotide pyrophosphohydrolase [Gammaproteobacteria bacterium]|nr:nucleotide pyrophosphohydrolase [Gammaproteobacteria bacterium]